MTISADKVSNLISSKDMKYDENVYLEISINKNNLAKLALSLTDTFSKKLILRDNQLINLRKLMTIPKKLCDPIFCKKIEIKKNIIKIFKNCISLIVELNEASKDHKNFKNKDYREHIRSLIVSLILII